MPMISCPHCGATRNPPREKLPAKPATARCPDCQQRFRFDPSDLSVSAAEKRVTCPNCGLPRAIPRHRNPGARQTLSCRRCQHSFQLAAKNNSAREAQRPSTKLYSVGRLLTTSWEHFCRRGLGMLVIYLLGGLLVAVPLALAVALLPQLKPTPALLWAAIGSGIIYGLLGSSWLSASIFSYICRHELDVLSAIKRGRKQFWQFSMLFLLLGLLVGGASLLLVIPGILLGIWFCFSQYVLADEGLHGIQALKRSRQLTRGHFWRILAHLLLLLLVALGFSTLTARLPLFGAPLNFVFSLLLTPFSLFYGYQLYLNLKQSCSQRPTDHTSSIPFSLATAVLGWMLIPGLLLAVSSWQQLPTADVTAESSAIISKLFNHDQRLLLEQAEQQEPLPPRQEPEALSSDDYDRLLDENLFPVPAQGIKLGPATLSAEHFWADEQEPHLWLRLELAELPNLALAHRHSTRILIDKVLDTTATDRYDRDHSFEHAAFHWVDILTDQAQHVGFGGIRNVYLKQGTRPEQIRSITGQLELKLPLGIESLQLDRHDIGKTIQVAGKTLTLEQLQADGVTVRYMGDRSELLSIRAVNQKAEPVPEAGSSWLKSGDTVSLKQMFSGDIDSVTILVASDSITRSYPFELTR